MAGLESFALRDIFCPLHWYWHISWRIIGQLAVYSDYADDRCSAVTLWSVYVT